MGDQRGMRYFFDQRWTKKNKLLGRYLEGDPLRVAAECTRERSKWSVTVYTIWTEKGSEVLCTLRGFKLARDAKVAAEAAIVDDFTRAHARRGR